MPTLEILTQQGKTNHKKVPVKTSDKRCYFKNTACKIKYS